MKVKLDPGAFLPERAYPSDAGMDLRSPVEVIVPAHGSAVINTGVHVQIPAGYAGFLKSKSGLNVKHGITSEGVIDSGYTGSIVVKLYNSGDIPFPVVPGDKISQLVVLPVMLDDVELAASIEGERGSNGFGSTGR